MGRPTADYKSLSDLGKVAFDHASNAAFPLSDNYYVRMCNCSLLPGNQILISKYRARRGVVVSGGWSNGSGWQQTTTTIGPLLLSNEVQVYESYHAMHTVWHEDETTHAQSRPQPRANE